MKRIKDKINEINEFLKQLNDLVPESLEYYKRDIKTKLACERVFEKIVEASVDLAFLTIKIKKLDIPEDDADSFNILKENKILDEKLSNKLKEAKSMRNFIAHQYGKIDDKLVFHSLTEELRKDVEEFIEKIKVKLKSK